VTASETADTSETQRGAGPASGPGSDPHSDPLTAFETLTKSLGSCRLVDLSSDVARHADGPFATRTEVLEPVPGAAFFCEHVLPKVAPEAVGRLRPEHFPDRAFLRHETVRASVHAGSHVDAPGHYGPLADGGTGFVNEAPLDAFVGPAVRFDVSEVPEDVIRLHHVEAAAAAEGVEGWAGAIVLLRTGGAKAISAEVVEACLDAGTRVIGTDGESFDGAFAPMIKRFLDSGDPDTLWPAHVLGRRRPYYQLERLSNLDRVPASGFVLTALPVLIEGATAAWTRAVAFVPGG
jgi:cyclase